MVAMRMRGRVAFACCLIYSPDTNLTYKSNQSAPTATRTLGLAGC